MLDRIEDAIKDIADGKVIIVVDDEDRENEGDFVCAAEYITPEIINFMATHGRGLICAPLLESRCEELNLEMMVGQNTSAHETPFTVSVDLIGHGCTTGISAADRAKTIKALINPETDPAELGRPGHIFPLKAKPGGVLRRAGHTEAAIDFPRLAGLKPAGVLIEIMNEDGTMARLPDLKKVAEKFDLKLVSIQDLIEYRLTNESLITKETVMPINTAHGIFDMHVYRQTNTDNIHLALVKGTWDKNDPVDVRVHSANLMDDIFGTVRQEEVQNILQASMERISQEGKGVILYMNQENMSAGLMQYIQKLKSQENTQSTSTNPKMDQKDYGVGAQILRDLGAFKLRLITNNPTRKVGLHGYGLEIIEHVPVAKAKKQ